MNRRSCVDHVECASLVISFLIRAGTSLDELQTGFSKAANSAMNDVDALVKSLDSLGIKGDDASRALTKALEPPVLADWPLYSYSFIRLPREPPGRPHGRVFVA